MNVMGIMGFILPVADTSKGWQPNDWLKQSGIPTAGRVTGGEVDGLALLQAGKHGDLNAMHVVAQAWGTSLGKAMLMLSAAMPEGERVTARAVSGIAQELEGALGGAYSNLSNLQKMFLDRFIYQMEKNNELTVLPAGLKDLQMVDIITGIAALNRQQGLDSLLAAMQIIFSVPGAAETVNMSTMVDRVLSGMMVDRKGLILTPEEIQAKMAAAAQQQLTSEAASQAIKTVGSMVEERAKVA
jgi:hypothetical protein